MRHLITIDDYDPHFLRAMLKRAQALKEKRTIYGRWLLNNPLQDRLLCTAFYEPSTRTRLSFESAMIQMGGHVIGTENAAEFSSAVKGETIADTFQVISGYCDIIVGRFRNEGEARIAADNSLVPVINGGDGKGEHPTQALIDLFSITEKFPEVALGDRKLSVCFMGDNLHSRTVQSLARLLARFDPIDKMTFVGPDDQNFDIDDGTNFLHGLRGISLAHGRPDGSLGFLCLPEMTPEVARAHDIIYVTRPQKERHADGPKVDRAPVVLTPELAGMMPEDGLILHPLPRNSELPVEVDRNPRAYYFEQARNGIPVRMALLEGLCLHFV